MSELEFTYNDFGFEDPVEVLTESDTQPTTRAVFTKLPCQLLYDTVQSYAQLSVKRKAPTSDDENSDLDAPARHRRRND